MAYPAASTNNELDTGDAIQGSHIKDVYDELGAGPKGARADVTDRFTKETLGGAGGGSRVYVTTDQTPPSGATDGDFWVRPLAG